MGFLLVINPTQSCIPPAAWLSSGVGSAINDLVRRHLKHDMCLHSPQGAHQTIGPSTSVFQIIPRGCYGLLTHPVLL